MVGQRDEDVYRTAWLVPVVGLGQFIGGAFRLEGVPGPVDEEKV